MRFLQCNSHYHKHCDSPPLTDLILAISLKYKHVLWEAEMKKFFMRIIALGILAGAGYLVCKKLCKKDNCGCSGKKEA